MGADPQLTFARFPKSENRPSQPVVTRRQWRSSFPCWAKASKVNYLN